MNKNFVGTLRALTAVLFIFVSTFSVLLIHHTVQNNNILAFHSDHADLPSSHSQPPNMERYQQMSVKNQRNNRVYCAVPSVIDLVKRWAAIIDGYGKYCDTLKIFIDPLTFQQEQYFVANTNSKSDIIFKNYPLDYDAIQPDDFEFQVQTSKGNTGTVVVVPMIRRNFFFDQNFGTRSKVENDLLLEKFKSFEGYLHYFRQSGFHEIGVCGDNMLCRHIWEKVWRMFTYIRNHPSEINSAEWFLKIDDDTFFIPQNLKKFVKKLNMVPDNTYYFGHKAYSPNMNGNGFLQFVSGVCSVFSRGSLIKMTKQYSIMAHEYGPRNLFSYSHGICVDRDGATEERVTAKCLFDANVSATLAAEKIENRFIIGKENYYLDFVPEEDLHITPNMAIRKKRQKKFWEHLEQNEIEAVHDDPQYLDWRLNEDEFNVGIANEKKDISLAELVLPLGLPFSLTYKRKSSSTSWYWKEKSAVRGDMLNCCSFHVFGIHGYKSSARMEEMFDYIYIRPISEMRSMFLQQRLGSEQWYYFWYILNIKLNLVLTE